MIHKGDLAGRTAGLWVGNEPAEVVLGNMPGQDINRRVFALDNDHLYQLTFLPMDENQPEVYAQREPNFSILRPGDWTYPVVTQGIISTTVTLAPGEYRGMLDFGCDHQFRP